MSERYLSVAAFAQRLDTSRQQVHRWIHDGEISCVRVGRLIRIDAAEVNAFVERHTVATRASQHKAKRA